MGLVESWNDVINCDILPVHLQGVTVCGSALHAPGSGCWQPTAGTQPAAALLTKSVL
jgi:hypothetical protein